MGGTLDTASRIVFGSELVFGIALSDGDGEIGADMIVC